MDAQAVDGALTTAEYDRLVRAADSYRVELLVALCGRVGLRPGEIARLRPGDLDRTAEGHHFLSVPGDDGDARDAYVPPDVADDVRKYADAAGLAGDDALFGVTARRLQMLVAEAARRAADGDDDPLADASTRDLRAHFARRLLVANDVDPRVVWAAGGWSSLGSLDPYVERPTREAVAAALSDADTPSDPDTTAETVDAGVDAATDVRAETSRPDSRGDDSVFAETAAALGRALTDATDRPAVEARACEALASVVGPTAVCDERGEIRAAAGVDDADARAAVADALRGTALPDAADGVRFVERGLDAEAWRADRTLAATPIRAGDRVHGSLCVVVDPSTRADGVRRALVDAGRRVGWAVAATDRRERLRSDAGVELVFEATGDSFFAATSGDLDCRLELDGVVPVAEQSLLCFVAAGEVAVDALLDRAGAASAVTDARLIRDAGDRAQLELVVRPDSPVGALVEQGGAVASLTAAEGVARVAAVFPTGTDVRAVVEAVTSAFPGVSLRAKREATRRASPGDVHRTLERDLTEKQRSTLRAAYLAGYFEWPRGSTAEELADSMDVSAPTLHNHLRKAQQKVFTALFDSPS
ncbi:putative DNA binding protein [Halarchaeum rubridurum]|uniref:Putative DNA binding protein n=1 Tax=Halarchaeum rubridurum TaxID=489911 RepID=A0A830FXB1_9EURY|nr:bacterio-opsin activator domain-containing protein [Halarchaeum rubridurum]MBP1954247.1 putative DNA binding protein [Halarchaeum rubridurum]GGM58486.1 XRE family transcriptional regulator [Halarchaeum rubridurum]